jgi:hypothetical protein
MNTRLRRGVPPEEEDAAALKLGPGSFSRSDARVRCLMIRRIQRSGLFAHFGGQVSVGEQRQGCT